MYPVVHGGSRKSQPEFGQHFYLTVLGQMVVVLVVDKRGQQVGAYMSASDDTARTFSLKYLRRWCALVAFTSQYRCDGFLHPQALRFQMQNIGLVLSDDIVVVDIDTLGINCLCLYRQSVYVVFFRTLAPASRLGFGFRSMFLS